MSVFQRKGSKVYYFDFRLGGRRFCGTTQQTSKKAAAVIERAERDRIARSTIDRGRAMNFAAASSLWWHQVASHTANVKNAEFALAWLQQNIGMTTPIAAIDDGLVADLVALRRGDGVANATVNRTVLEPLRAILRRAKHVWHQDVAAIGWRQHFLREQQERVREATAAEQAAIEAAIRADYRPLIRFAFLTGCRRGEIIGLTWPAVDFFSRQFTVTGKGDRRRTIPMTASVYDLLWQLKGDHELHVFTYRAARPRDIDGRRIGRGEAMPVSVEGVKSAWRRAIAAADVRDFRFHDMRHTAATRLVRAAGNLKLAQQLLGHADIATTARYAHASREDLRAGLAAAEKATAAPIAPDDRRRDGAVSAPAVKFDD